MTRKRTGGMRAAVVTGVLAAATLGGSAATERPRTPLELFNDTVRVVARPQLVSC